MKEYFYLDFLKKNIKYAELLQYELDKRFYYFGNHFKNNFESNKLTKSKFLHSNLVQVAYFLYKNIFRKRSKDYNVIISSVYFNFGAALQANHFDVYNVPWTTGRQQSLLTFREFLKLRRFSSSLEKASLAELLSDEFESKIDRITLFFKQILLKYKVRALLLPNDVGFFERLILQIAKELNIPTFIVLHGAALRYGNCINDNKADFLCVFGEIMKSKLVASGFAAKKIIVLGHPKYSELTRPKVLRFSLENVLIITKPLPGQPVEIADRLVGRDRDTNRLKDRSNAILYIWMIEKVLRSFGVKRAILRPHPSENPNWYRNNLSPEFFLLDESPLSDSLQRATLVIGPSSSLFLDALFAGVNYTVFEPKYDDHLDILNDPIGHPFDGSDEKVPVATDEIELGNILSNQVKVELNFLDYFVKNEVQVDQILGVIKSAE